jgi:hypothetical protein
MLIEKSSSFSSLIFPRESETGIMRKLIVLYFPANFFVVYAFVHENA